MTTAKRIGLLLVAFGVLAIVLPAALPATITRQGSGIVQFRAGHDNCGSAFYAALEYPDRSCGHHARHRLVRTTTGGALLMIVGVVMLTGRDSRQRSRVSAS